jgi:hypothetical protein
VVQCRLVNRLCIAALALATVLAGCSDESDPAQAPSATAATAVTTAVTSSQAPAPRTPVPLVLAERNGVVFVPPDGDPVQISTTPAAIAFGLGTDTFVYQDAAGSTAVYPPVAGGPIRVWSAGKVRTLAGDPNASGIWLLDARKVGDVPTVLVAERQGDAPTNRFEELVAIDLRTDARRIIVRRPAWESSHEAGRLLPEGDVAGLFHSEASVLLARWSAQDHRAVWTKEIGSDMRADLLWRTGALATAEYPYEEDGRVVTVIPRDLATGAAGPAEKVAVQDPDGTLRAGLFCMDWLSPDLLACARSDGGPVALSRSDGRITRLPGERGAIPTAIHSQNQ